MALTITHSAVVVTPDDGTSEVGSAEWNDDHVVSGTLAADVEDMNLIVAMEVFA